MFELDFTPLSEQEVRDAPKIADQDVAVPVMPVPPDAPPLDFMLSGFGAPTAQWRYQNADDQLLGYLLRFDDAAGQKKYLPATYCKLGESFGWWAKGFPPPYPLYNARGLALRPTAPVMIVHGEKAADAAQSLFPQYVVTTSPFGFGLAHNADWSAMKNRDIVICPDFSETAPDMVAAYVAALKKIGPRSVRGMPPKLIANSIWKEGRQVRRPIVPLGWDLHDALEEGWTSDRVATQLSDTKRFKRIDVPMKLDLPGAATFFLTDDGIEAEMWVNHSLQREWMCDELSILALVRDSQGTNWAKMVRFTTADGSTKDLILSAPLLAGEATVLRESLLDAGFRMSSTRFARERLTEFISRSGSERRMLHVERIGWHEGAFVTANQTFGEHPSGEKLEYRGTDKTKVGQTAGTLEGWQNSIASPVQRSAGLVFAISCALAAPLIHIAQGESGGFHFVGSSSIGKTTALQIAGSVWGGGGVEGYLKTWRATSNGLEGIAAAHCDVLLCLDEISQARGSEAGQCAYMLGNGTGKVRANRFGGARPPLTWRVMILSSGELTLEAKVREERGTARAAAGQLVRFVDLPADEGYGTGMFGNLAGSEPEMFARMLKKASAENYGHAGLRFVDHLASDLNDAAETVKNLMAAFVVSLGLDKKADGQVRRVAQRFALVAAAGEMAISAKILPWKSGTVRTAAESMFRRWIEARGGQQATEETEALEQVRYFLNKNSNFLVPAQGDGLIAASAGFIRSFENVGKCYCFPPEVWRRDVCQGLDPHLVARVLQAKGHLATDDGRLQKQVRLGRQRQWVYAVRETLLVEVVADVGGKRTADILETFWESQ